jgi:hypothetical protein
MDRDGVAWLKGSQATLFELAGRLGDPVPVRRGGPTLDRLVPVDRDAAPSRTLSALYGVGRFPMHTDAASHRIPPRFLLLRFDGREATTTPTQLLDFNSLDLGPREMAALRREVWLVRGGVGRTFYTTILSRTSIGQMVRFDPGCMEPALGTDSRGLPALLEAFEGVEPVDVYWQPEEIVVIDNWRFVHGRGAVDLEHDRVLERVLVRA